MATGLGMEIFSSLDRYTQNTAVIQEDGRTFSYANLIENSDCYTNELKKNTLMLMLCSNHFDSICCYVGALRHGIVPLLLPDSIHEKMLISIVKAFEPAYIWSETEKDMLLDAYVIIKKTDAYVLYSVIDWKEPRLFNAELALLLPTSGSMANSNMVKLSMKNLMANTESILSYLPIQAKDRVMLTLPMNYSYGLSIINTHLVKGATILLPAHSIVDYEFWEFYHRQKVTTFGGVPYTYKMLEKVGFFSRQASSPLSYITQAGGKLPLSLNQKVATWCKDNQIDFFVMYGQTEATARIAYLAPESSIDKCGSIGKAIKDGTIRLEDEQGNQINQAYNEGILFYSGPNVGLGYAVHHADLQTEDRWNGTLNTGDIAYFDKDGYYYIVGRSKRFIKVFGVRVSLDGLEHLLAQNNYQCACIGKDDSLTVYTETHDYTDTILELLVDVANIPAAIVSIIEIKALPRNEAGKIRYSQLEDNNH